MGGHRGSGVGREAYSILDTSSSLSSFIFLKHIPFYGDILC